MKLAIITDEGEVVDVAEDLEEFNLSKLPARAYVIDSIIEGVNIIREDLANRKEIS